MDKENWKRRSKHKRDFRRFRSVNRSRVHDEIFRAFKSNVTGAFLVIVLRKPSASSQKISRLHTYRNDQRAGPWAQLLVLVEVPAQCDTVDLGDNSRRTKLEMSQGIRNKLRYRFSSPDWRGPRCTFFNSKTARRVLTTILDTNSVPRVLVRTSPRM